MASGDDFLSNLLGGHGCNDDGTTSRNPITSFVDNIFNNQMLMNSNNAMEAKSVDMHTSNSSEMSGFHEQRNDSMMPSMDGNMNNQPFSESMWESGQLSVNGDFDGNGMGVAFNPNMMQNQSAMMMQQQQFMMQQMAMQQIAMHQQMHEVHMQQINHAQSEQYLQPPPQHQDAIENHDEEFVYSTQLEAETELGQDFHGFDTQFDARLQDETIDTRYINEVEGAETDAAYTSAMQQLQESSLEQSGTGFSAAEQRVEHDIFNNQDTYAFNEYTENAFEDSLDAFERGLELYKQGDIPNAIMAFETELKRDMEHAECWRYLGLCHAENDEEAPAITCFRNALKYDPYNIDALLVLGASYTNESDTMGAVTCIKNWVHNNPSFHDIQHQEDGFGDGTVVDECIQLMLNVSNHVQNSMFVHHSVQEGQSQSVSNSGAVMIGGEDSNIMVQVNTVLGVLYNISRDYNAATECFKRALDYSPNDFSLWNKVGATLSNGDNSKDAIPMYSKALTLRPKYARGWLNLGISYYNLEMFNEASKAFVKAIQLSPTADHIWGYLRLTLAGLDRMDLVQLCNTAMNKTAKMEVANSIAEKLA